MPIRRRCAHCQLVALGVQEDGGKEDLGKAYDGNVGYERVALGVEGGFV